MILVHEHHDLRRGHTGWCFWRSFDLQCDPSFNDNDLYLPRSRLLAADGSLTSVRSIAHCTLWPKTLKTLTVYWTLAYSSPIASS